MAEFKTLALDKILVPDRLRAVEDDEAFMIAQSISRVGLLNPITVRSTPAAARPYTLIAGAHRLRATELAGLKTIDAAVVKADMAEGQMVEIEENIFRNDLSALDRAIFVQKYRELWEEKNGEIRRGNPDLANSDNLTELDEDSAQGQFFLRVSERMGLSRRGVERAQFIGKRLSPDLRSRLRGTAVADNQSQLLKLARLEGDRQRLVATALDQGHELPEALDLTDPAARAKAVKSVQQELLERLISTWARTDEKTRTAFLAHVEEKARQKAARSGKASS